MKVHFDSKFFISITLVGFVGLFMFVYNLVVGKPKRLRSKLRKQGISGPPPHFLFGNIRDMHKHFIINAPKSPCVDPPAIHDCASLFPFLQAWKKNYGQVFMFSIGSKQILYVDKPEMVRELTTCTSSDLGRPQYLQKELGPLLGNGVFSSSGAIWAKQRKMIAPQLYMDKVKGMVTMIGECGMSLIKSWSDRIEAEGGVADINADECLGRFSADVISGVLYGSDFSKGKEILSKVLALQDLMANRIVRGNILGMGYLPTKNNRKAWALSKEIKKDILQMINKGKGTGDRNGLMQNIVEAAKNSDLTKEAIESFIVDNCKTIYSAAYDPFVVSASWCLMLLASNQHWQDRVRAEILEICNGRIPDSDMLPKMKQLTMVIHETLRLYSPSPLISRETLEDMKFGNIVVPKGVFIWTMIFTSHTDPDIWGPDAFKFKPERFANGIKGACKHPQMYMPFGMGPRVCFGRDLAMTQLKILLALILSEFSFTLSHKYIHSPKIKVVVHPEHGVHLLVKKL